MYSNYTAFGLLAEPVPFEEYDLLCGGGKQQKRKRERESSTKITTKRHNKESVLKPLPKTLHERFKQIRAGPPARDNYVVAKDNDRRLQILQKDIKTLINGTWLNDVIINTFFKLLDESEPKLMCFSSFFLDAFTGNRGYDGVRKWTKRRKIDIFALDQVLFPINIGRLHWAMVGCDMQKKTITYYDSINSPNKNWVKFTKTILKYLVQEHNDKKKTSLNPKEWRLIKPTPPAPQQTNGYDCGVFTCICGMHVARKLPLNYNQDQMAKYWRPFIGCSILKLAVLPHTTMQ